MGVQILSIYDDGCKILCSAIEKLKECFFFFSYRHRLISKHDKPLGYSAVSIILCSNCLFRWYDCQIESKFDLAAIYNENFSLKLSLRQWQRSLFVRFCMDEGFLCSKWELKQGISSKYEKFYRNLRTDDPQHCPLFIFLCIVRAEF